MSPSIQDLEINIGRKVKRGDVLIDHQWNVYEVVALSDTQQPVLRTIVPRKPVEGYGSVPREIPIYTTIVKVEDREDAPSLRER